MSFWTDSATCQSAGFDEGSERWNSVLTPLYVGCHCAVRSLYNQTVWDSPELLDDGGLSTTGKEIENSALREGWG